MTKSLDMAELARAAAEAAEHRRCAADVGEAAQWPEPTEDSVARAFADRRAGQIIFDHTSGIWHIWRDGRWARDERHRVFNDARDFTRLMRAGIPKAPDAMGKINFASNVERATRADPRIAVSHEVWDRDRWLLGIPGGVIDLRTGKQRTASPDLYIGRQCNVAPTPDAAGAPLWHKFLADATNHDDELQAFLQRLAGYLLTGDITEEVVTFLYGSGGNGKGVFLGALSAIMGEYAVGVPIEVFTANSRINLEYYRAQMAGARLVTASETEAQASWAEAQIKEMTGNETPLSARHPYGQPFTYSPQFKIVLVGNHAPKLKGRSPAMERRLRVIPFDHKPANPDYDLKDKLRDEYPAILRWMIDGCLAWQKARLGNAEAVQSATSAYFEQQDAFRRWMDERCELDPNFATKPGALLADFNAWARGNGEDTLNNGSFAEMIERADKLTRTRSNGVRLVKGIALKPDHGWQSDGSDGQ